MKKSIPKWIIAVSGLISLLGLFVGISLYFFPGVFIPGIDFSSSDVKYLTDMWAARQIAIAAIIGFSVLVRSSPMLGISLAAYSLMNIQDALIGYSRSDYGLLIGATVFCLISAFMIIRLSVIREQAVPDTLN
jgi:hypothetical protein